MVKKPKRVPLCSQDKEVKWQVHLSQSSDDQQLLLTLDMMTAFSCSCSPTSFCLSIFSLCIKNDTHFAARWWRRNACFTDQKQRIALEQNCLSVLYHQSLWLYPSPPPLRLLWFWGWWQQDRHHYLNTKKHREEALILELWCADTQTTYLETHGLPRACTSAFAYSFIHKYLLSFHYPWILGIVSASARALLQSILSSIFRMILLKPISHSLSPNLLSPLRLKAWLPYNGPIHGPQSSLWPISFQSLLTCSTPPQRLPPYSSK